MDKPIYEYEALKEGLVKIDTNIERIEEAMGKAQENIASCKNAIQEERFKPGDDDVSLIKRAEDGIKKSEQEIEQFKTAISNLNEQKFELMFYIKEHERYNKRKDK